MTPLRRLLLNNIGLKLLSLGLAVLLWAALGSDPITETVFEVHVEFVEVPSGLEISYEHPSVHLRVRGLSRDVRQAVPSDFSARLDLSPITGPGERTFSLNPKSVGAPFSLEVLQVIPSEIRVAAEQTLSKEVPIRPRFSGELTEGLRVKNFEVRPTHATIEGPRSRVSPIVAASTDPVDLSLLTGQGKFVTTAYVSDPLVRFAGPQTVEVTVEMEPSAGGGQDASQPAANP